MSKQRTKIYKAKEGYDKIVKEYKKMHNYLDTFENNKVVSLLRDIKGKKVLDAGAGTGRLLKHLVNAGALVTAFDISPNMLNEIKKRYNNVNVVQGNVEEMPFEKNSFDIVICTFVIVHLSEIKLFLDEVYRVLKNDGQFVLGNINQSEPVPVITKDETVKVESYYHSQEEVIAKLSKSGFFIDKQEIIKENNIWINQIILAVK